MPYLRLLVAALVLGLPCAGGRTADAEDDALKPDEVERALGSPLAEVRARAVRSLTSRGAEALPQARAWVQGGTPALRTAGWQVLAHLGRDEDGRAAVKASADTHPGVAAAAARCVLKLAATLPVPDDPWLPAGSLAAGAVRPLALALGHDFDTGDPNSLPLPVHRLGEGLLPVLTAILAHPRFGVAAKRDCLRSLAVLGGKPARLALSAQVQAMDGPGDPLWGVWWESVNRIAVGSGLAGAQAHAVSLADAFHPSRGGSRRLSWRDRLQYFRFLAHAPPAEGGAIVREYLEYQIAIAAGNARRRFYPSLAAAVVRACLINCEPSDALLELSVLCAQARARGGSRRRMEELGEVLVLLAPYRKRQGVQDGLEKLLSSFGLPRTVRAWALHLRGGEPRDQMVTLAEDLIDADGKAATLAQRRLGARLLGELGTPSLARIRMMLDDLDAWMRAMGLSWLQRAVREGVDGAEALWAGRRARLLADSADSVFLVAAERYEGRLDGAMQARLLRMGVQGALGSRGRVWRLVERLLPVSGDSSEAFRAPGGYASLDERLRTAGHARALWAR